MTTSTPTAHGTHPTGTTTTGVGIPAGTGVHGMILTGHGTGDGDPHGAGVLRGDRLGLGALHGDRAGVLLGEALRGEADVRTTIPVIPEHTDICLMAEVRQRQAHVPLSALTVDVIPDPQATTL